MLRIKEKTADEMFKELGFKKFESDTKIAYVNIEGKDIMFSKLINRVGITGKYYFIDMQELQAINKKCKELGWI